MNNLTEERKFIKELIDFIRFAQVSSGICCCGDSMEGHQSPMYSGHVAVDVWDYSVGKFIEKYNKFEGDI